MIRRRALIAAGLSYPLAAAAKSPWKGYYATGTRQRAVRFAGSDGATLAGTLLLPAWSELQRVPGIVLVAGSGPTDRDGNNPLVPQHIDVLKLIAELLATAGIGTLRSMFIVSVTVAPGPTSSPVSRFGRTTIADAEEPFASRRGGVAVTVVSTVLGASDESVRKST